MYIIIVQAWDIDYFDQKYPVSEIEVTKNEEVIFVVNDLEFAGIVREVTEPPDSVFSEDELVSVVHLSNELSATVVARTLSSLDVAASSITTGNCPLNEDEHQWLLDEMLDTTEAIVRFAGYNVEIVGDDWKIVPPTGTVRTLKLVLGAPAPGFWQKRHVDSLFGTPVCKNGSISIASPTVDMGIVVKNQIDEPIAQIIEHTIYLFLPLLKSSHKALSQEGGNLFGRALSLAWNEYRTGCDVVSEPKSIDSIDEFLALTPSPQQERERVKEALAGADIDIEIAQQKLRDAMSHKRILVTLLNGIDCRPEIDHEEAWGRLTEHFLFEKVVKSTDDQKHYFTKPIVYKDESGEERYLGRFGIRLHNTNNIAVWSLDCPHRNGVPHPHISHYGSVCLGNVTESIWHLLVEDREIDAVILVMQLLAEGYDAVLTEHRVEEWPTVTEYERRKNCELFTPSTHVEPRLDPPSDSIGSGLGCGLRDLSVSEGGSS